jgi:exodeoxyribonuclease VII small subunit
MNAIADPETLTYEEAVRALEELITQLEAPQITLDETISLYERGQALAKRCAGLLEQAELRLRQLGAEEA